MKARRWKKKKGLPFYRYDGKLAMSFIFRSPVGQLWAWGIWANKFTAGGVECSRGRARGEANAELDRIEQAK